MSDISPYAPAAPQESLRTFKPDPRKHIFSKWSLIKWLTYGICLALFLLAATDPNPFTQKMKGIVLISIIGYYFTHFWRVATMEKTLSKWGYRIRGLTGKRNKVLWEMDEIELGEACPAEKIIIIDPFSMVLLKTVDDEYFTMFRGFPKANITENTETLEFCVKKFLDGLTENLVFSSDWYTISDPKKITQKVVKEALDKPENSKATDIHLQGLGIAIDQDERVQVAGKQIYSMSLGKCRDIEKAISQFRSIVPGLEDKLKPALDSMYRITDPEEIIGIFKEMYGSEEVVD
jgi:hypothetical protein